MRLPPAQLPEHSQSESRAVAPTSGGRLPGAPSTLAPWEWATVVLITLGGAWLRWRQIGEQGLWIDEAFSIWMARLPLAEMLAWLTHIDQHPPLYYGLLHGWLALGESEATVRSLSALLGAATIPVLWLTSRRLFGPAAAIGAALLLAASPFHVRFGQEIRMYALLSFNAAAALLALAHLFTGDTRRRWWVVYVLFTALTLFSHNTALLFPVAVNAAAPAVWAALRLRKAAQERLDLPPLRDWLVAQAAVLLLWSPWAWSFVRQVRMVDAEFWIQPPTRATIVDTLAVFFGDWLPHGNDWFWAVLVGALLLGIVGAWRRAGAVTLLLVLAALPFVAELLISLRRPIFYDRTLIWTTLPLFLLLGAGLRLLQMPAAEGRAEAQWTRRGAGVGAALLLAAVLAGGYMSLVNYYDHYQKEEWREAAAWASARLRPQDLLLFNATWAQIPFDFYVDRDGAAVARHGAPVDLFDAGVLEPIMTEADVPRLREVIAPHACIWLVYSHEWYTDPQALVPATLRETLTLRELRRFAGLQLQLWERPDSGGECLPRQ